MVLTQHPPLETKSYWNEFDLEQVIGLTELSVEQITTEEIIRRSVIIGRRILLKMPDDIAIVCGPSEEKDTARFNRAVHYLSRRVPIFDQLPFEQLFLVIHAKKSLWDTLLRRKSSLFVANHFYEELFDDTKRWRPYFMSGWEKCPKASFQHELFQKRGTKAFYRSDSLLNDFH